MNIFLFSYIILFAITLIVLYRRQKKASYLKVGWFFNLLTFSYYGFPILFIVFFPELAQKAISRNFSTAFINKISIILLICQAGFLISELFVKLQTTLISSSKEYKLLNSYFILVLLIITYISFFYKWSSVGGFSNIIGLYRFEYMNEAAEASNLWARYDLFFYIVTSILIYNIVVSKEFIKKNKLLIVLYGIFVLLTLLMGNRLLLLTFFIGLFSGLFLFHKGYLQKNKKKIVLLSLFFILAFSAFKSIYTQIPAFLLTGNHIDIDKNDISYIPSELFTGLLSHHSIENGVLVDEFSYFKRLVPNRVLRFFDYDGATPFTQLIASESHYTSGRAVYTVPYLTDLYFSTNKSLFVFFIMNILIYSFFSFMQFKIANRNIIFLILFYVLMYYVFRAETSVWFGRFYLSFFLMYLVLKLGGKRLYIVHHMN